MPELAEAEFYRKQWDPGLNETIDRAEYRTARPWRGINPALTTQTLKGLQLIRSHRIGKQLTFELSHHHWLGLHLGMTGALLVAPCDHPPGPHDLLILRQKKRSLVFRDSRRFGRICFEHNWSRPSWWANLAPEPTDPVCTLSYLTRQLQKHRRAPIKALLLNQSVCSGLGNWMADEILWRGGFHPALPCGALEPDQIAHLRRIMRKACRDALRVIGQNWGNPPDSWLFQHRWHDGGICPRCRTPLRRAPHAGRTTAWCPTCQPDPKG